MKPKTPRPDRVSLQRFQIAATILAALSNGSAYPIALVRSPEGVLATVENASSKLKVGGHLGNHEVLMILRPVDVNDCVPVLTGIATLLFLAEPRREWSLTKAGCLIRNGSLCTVHLTLGDDVSEAHATVMLSKLAMDTAAREFFHLTNCCRADALALRLI